MSFAIFDDVQEELYGDFVAQFTHTSDTQSNNAEDANQPDMVHNPKHYQVLPGVEVTDIRCAILTRMESKQYPLPAVCAWSEAIAYLLRFDQKNGVEDLKKARQHLNLAINYLEGHPERKFN